MRKSILLGLGWATAGAIAAALTIQSVHSESAVDAAKTDIYRHLNLFGDVFDRVRADYVEKPEEGKLIDAAINGMLTSLDPHSSYMNAKTFREMQVQTRGEFGGLGIEVTMENGVVKVVTPIADTPAERAGIRAGDLITDIDGEPVMGLTLSQAVEKMRGRVNTPITLTVVREGVEEPFDVRIVRDIIRIRAVRSRVEDDIGYIRITTFNEQTQENLNAAVKKLKAEIGSGLKGYVLDLRNNPGGLLDQAISVSDSFLDRGVIVVTRGRNAEEHQRFSASKGDIATGEKMVVLINGGSASASEIVAGALQDHKRAKVIGTRSFGKGSVQTIIPLGTQGALRLTTARYYTPSGQSIQAKGIVPDIRVEQEIPEEEKKKRRRRPRGEASLRGHLKGDDGQEQKGSPSYVPADKEDDKQLIFALNHLRGIRQGSENGAAKSGSIAN